VVLCPRSDQRRQILPGRLPVAVLFVPSNGGISHHWAEVAKREDFALGLAVLAEGARRVPAASRRASRI